MTALTVVLSVGTDHHPFHRLIDAVLGWIDNHRQPVHLVAQHGACPPPKRGEDYALLDRATLIDLYRSADVIVTQVGPGTIADVNAAGRRPIVVPRDPALNEVIDDHQFAYGRMMDDLGYAWNAETIEHLHHLLELAASDHSLTVLTARARATETASTAFAAIAETVGNSRCGTVSLRAAVAMMRAPTTSPVVGGEPS